jgi:hypothetical protein
MEIHMSADSLRQHLRNVPFRPFRLYISGGMNYEVRNPDWMMVMPRTTAVGVPGQSGDGEVVVTIDNLHITHVEPLSITVAG